MNRKNDPARRTSPERRGERIVYVVLIVLLTLYGLKDSGAAVALLGAIKDAFSLLINHTP